MSMFLLAPDDDARIKEAAGAARRTPVTLDQLKAAARPDIGGGGTLPRIDGDRPDNIPSAQVVNLPLGWRLNISAEEQPFGPCLHLSLSSPTPETTAPRPEAMFMILQALGRTQADVAHFWLEDFSVDGKPAGKALNLLVQEPLQ